MARCDLAGARVQRDRCDLGLGAVMRCGVVCAISSALLSLCDLGFGSFFFFFGNGLKVSLEIGSGLWGGTIWAGQSLTKVILDMGFGPCEECA